MTLGEWIGVGSALAGILGPVVTWGMIRQKVADLKEKVDRLATRESFDAIEAQVSNLASKESVSAVEGRVGKLETDMREARVALATIPLISEKLTGFEKLMTSQVEEVRHGVRGIRQAIDELAPRRVSRDHAD